MDIHVFFTELDALFKKMEYETASLKGEEIQLGDTLRVMLPIDEAGNKVLMEIMAMSYTDDAILVQIYSTMIAEIGPGYEALKEMLLDWNLTCPLGAFGIYRQGRQFYHKYNYTLPTDGDPKEMAMEVFYIIHLIQDVIGRYFPDIVRLSGNL
ncbi:MAG: hypothetical protein IJI41_13550 [Anaerolineaceae bacterium]|nr:hypothetical protein [Anaerolineaceae bacterium]